MFIAASVKAVGSQQGQRSTKGMAALQTFCVLAPFLISNRQRLLNDREKARQFISGLNLLSMSDSFKTIQTHSKQRYFTASQVLYKAKVADQVLLGEAIWLLFVRGLSSVAATTTCDTYIVAKCMSSSH